MEPDEPSDRHFISGLSSKRGADLSLSLERLDEIAEAPPQRIGLSATCAPDHMGPWITPSTVK